MAEYEYHYADLTERQQRIAEAEGLGYELLHDNFDSDWKRGDEPHGTLVFTDTPTPPTDEQLYQEQLTQEFNDKHTTAIQALNNWDSLTVSQKDTLLKNILKWALWKDGRLTLGVLE